MKALVRVFEVDPASPASEPVELEKRVVESTTLDEARGKARDVLTQEGRRIRGISFGIDGDLVVYVFPPQPPEPPKETKAAERRRKKR